ncbi:MAG: hypothetical protein JW735_06305 [Prolixibacteraceae bacterium]|nr:hypothetical protein [Prolixibacteraceae bacterium]
MVATQQKVRMAFCIFDYWYFNWDGACMPPGAKIDKSMPGYWVFYPPTNRNTRKS